MHAPLSLMQTVKVQSEIWQTQLHWDATRSYTAGPYQPTHVRTHFAISPVKSIYHSVVTGFSKSSSERPSYRKIQDCRDVMTLGRFDLGRFDFGTFWLGTFWLWDVLTLGRFDIGTFWPVTVCNNNLTMKWLTRLKGPESWKPYQLRQLTCSRNPLTSKRHNLHSQIVMKGREGGKRNTYVYTCYRMKMLQP